MGESIRDLGLEGQVEKAGTPTMGGVIIILATLVPVFLLAKLENIYVILLIITTLWMGAIGFMDDFLKIRKKNKEGLQGKFKIFGQVGLGIIVGATMFFHPGITVKEENPGSDTLTEAVETQERQVAEEEKALTTTIPFVKDNEVDYSILVSWLGDDYVQYAWLLFIPIVIFIVTAVSNGANLTDGIDGLATSQMIIQQTHLLSNIF